MSDSKKAAPAMAKPGQSRRTLLMIAGPVFLLLVAAVWWITGGRYEETDNAYLHLGRVTVAADVGGRVVSVMVADNQAVKAGDTLFEVDPTPYKLALAKADTAVSVARLAVDQLKQAYQQALASERVAQTDADYLNAQLARQVTLEAKGAATDSAARDARHAADVARDKLDLARQTVAQTLVAIAGQPDIAVDSHPNVQAAMVVRNQAAYDLSRTRVTAPRDGIVYQASGFRQGQVVSVGQPLFSFVESGDVWVDANFKETQLAHLRVGQKAEVTLDADKSRHLTAVVDAIGAGTGAEFSLLPAQNATGNWVKVTQRVPVRLRLTEAFGPGLASGLSATVEVDTGYKRSFLDLLPGWASR